LVKNQDQVYSEEAGQGLFYFWTFGDLVEPHGSKGINAKITYKFPGCFCEFRISEISDEKRAILQSPFSVWTV